MKKPFLLSVFLFTALLYTQAQEVLMVKKAEKGLYLDHLVTTGEGLYSVGRLYNVHPRYIANYNKIDYNKGLEIGQMIRIPLTDTNFNQKTKKGVPVYYTVLPGEGLYKVSTINNKVPAQKIKEWNSLTNDNIHVDSKLVIGFLNSKESAALTARLSKIAPASVSQETAQKQEDKPAVKAPAPEEKVVVKPEPSKETPKNPDAKPEVKKVETVAEVKPTPKEETKRVEPVFAKEETHGTASEQGYFKTSFDQQVKSSPISKNSTVTSGIFKTASGWQDGKYYLLLDGVASGTIVKVINPENNKIVYAKVLGEMNGIRQNQGFDIRISNSAASALGITDTEKFIVKLNY